MDEQRPTYIYALLEPGDAVEGLPPAERVRYVGKTVNPKRRLIMHLYANDDTYRDRWVRSLRATGVRPVMVMLETAYTDWATREQFWICFYRENGACLTNLTDGGDGLAGRVVPEEEKQRISESNKRYWAVPENKAKRAETWKTTYAQSPELRQTLDDCMRRARSHHQDPDYKEKHKAAQQRRWQDPEARKRASETSRRKAQDPETKRKQSEAGKRRWADPQLAAARGVLMHAGKIRKQAERLAVLSLPSANDD